MKFQLLILCALVGASFANKEKQEKNIPLHIPRPSLEHIQIPFVKLNMVKGGEVIKHVPQEVIEEVPIEHHVSVSKPVEVVKPVPVTKEVIVERPVEVIKEIPIEKVIIDKVEVPYEVIKHVEKVKHIPIEKHVEVIKQVEVIKPVPYKRYVFNKVPSTINYQIPEYVKVPYSISAQPSGSIADAYEKTDEQGGKGWGFPSPVGFVKRLIHQ
ncbi:zinc finger protein 512B-like [Armigeres subalbatus]|uniref:zinc finger protein 512B-like n=1 Tax=Armigeres subalbatus TaxID=124917 RepID=UPI002ED3EB31